MGCKEDLRETSVQVLKARKKCDLCLKEKCDKRCKYRKNYTYQQIEKAYNEALAYMESRPIICPSCGKGCFDFNKYCSHCGIKLNTKSNKGEK